MSLLVTTHLKRKIDLLLVAIFSETVGILHILANKI